ncbi:MAG: HNH endonuclease [Chitinophagaceae bacterium]|nr:HNH endonuclease [Chitinophagaceae bacterium]
MEKLKNIVFDHEDRELFLVDDLQLKADAIRYSILPKMQIVVNYAISQIKETYKVNVFENSMIAQAPHYRLNNRKGDMKKDYDFARISIRGQRKFENWKGIETPSGGQIQASPFTLDLILTNEGLHILLKSQSHRLSKNSNKKVFGFLMKYSSTINLIQKAAKVFDKRICTGNDWLIDNEIWLKDKFKRNDFDISMISDFISYPIKSDQLSEVIVRMTLLYPIYHSFIQIGMGQNVKFSDLIVKFDSTLLNKSIQFSMNQKVNESPIDLKIVKERAATKIKVMPGIRWQVFKRDNWRCVSCGVKAVENDTVILHVDHILPRSKGGKDEMINFQTLCDKCNLGKSNTDKTDLRNAD